MSALNIMINSDILFFVAAKHLLKVMQYVKTIVRVVTWITCHRPSYI